MTIKPCKNCLFDLCGTLVDIHTDEDAPPSGAASAVSRGAARGYIKSQIWKMPSENRKEQSPWSPFPAWFPG